MSAPDPSSRYAGLPTIRVRAPDGSIRLMGAPRIVPRPPLRGSYAIRPGDRLDLLGLRASGDSTRWWVLADANPWSDATRLEEPGRRIELPDG